jgi:GTPase Era involved in 16S rRNA processing
MSVRGANHGSNAQALLFTLSRAKELLGELGGEFAPEQNCIEELESRLGSARFHLAVLGQFKRGKSTLLNALLGEEILPSAVIPVTSVPTFLSWGPERLVKVIFLDGHTEDNSSENVQDAAAFLAKYVTETGNPKNRLGVAQVEVVHPSPLLQKGVVLIDTPGIGSTFQHNTEATLNFLPQCDGALFLISADPPITQVEIEFLKAVQSKVVRTLFIMNKVDYLREGERQSAIEFFQSVLREQFGLDGHEPVFPVSARQGLEAKLKGNASLWVDSGMSSIEDFLVKFLADEKMQILHLAVVRKASDILENSLLRLRLKQRSLTLPLEDLERRLSVFNQKLEEIEHERLLAQDILSGDQKRLVETLHQECAGIVKEAEAKLYRIIEESSVTTIDISQIEKMMHSRFAEVIPELFGGGLAKIQQLVNQRTQDALGAHRERANALAEIIRRTAAELFEIPYTPGKSSDALEIRHRPYWVTEHWSVAMSPIPRGLFERLLPRSMALRRIKKWIRQDIEAIVLRNVESLQWATWQNIDETFRRFSLDLDQELKEIANATRGAIQESHTKRMQKADNVSEEISKLSIFETRLQEIQKELSR